MPKKNNGLGRGLDSLIPSDFYDEDFDSNSSESLEDVLNDKEEKAVETKVEKPKENKKDKEVKEDKKPKVISEDTEDTEVDTKVNQDESDDLNDDLVQEHVNEVLEIVKKNPRITLWSVRSSAVFRYLRKTKPEFSISKEASSLIDEAVSKKYPEIWELFKDI